MYRSRSDLDIEASGNNKVGIERPDRPRHMIDLTEHARPLRNLEE